MKYVLSRRRDKMRARAIGSKVGATSNRAIRTHRKKGYRPEQKPKEKK